MGEGITYLSCVNAAVQYSFNKKQMQEGDQEIRIKKKSMFCETAGI